MSASPSYPHRIPTPRSARLGAELRRIREATGLTAAAVCADMEIARHPSWLSRVEAGAVKLSVEQVYEILQVCGASNDEVASLMALANNLDEPRWWQPLGTLQHRYLTYMGYEEEARLIRNWEPLLIPGLLQTEAYAKAVLSVGWVKKHGDIEERLKARLGRQTILTKPDPVHLHAIVSEAALECQVGGPRVQRDQFRHLHELTVHIPNLTIQVVPYSAGEHATYHSFALLDLKDDDLKLGFVDQLTESGYLIEGANEITRLEEVFNDLAKYAMSPQESIDWIWSKSWTN